MLTVIEGVLRNNPEFSMFLYIFIPLLLLITTELIFICVQPRLTRIMRVRFIQLLVNTTLILTFCFWFFSIYQH